MLAFFSCAAGVVLYLFRPAIADDPFKGGADASVRLAPAGRGRAGAPPALAQAPTPTDTLYQRLGGYDAIAALVDEILAHMEEEKFAGVSTDSRMRTRQMIVDFICSETGGPCYYAGRDIETAHAGLGIDEEDWQQFVVIFGESAASLELPEQATNELAEALLPLKDQVVEE